MKSNAKYSSNIIKKMRIRCCIAFVIIIVVLIILAFMARTLANQFIWYPSDGLYWLFKAIERNLPLVIIAAGAITMFAVTFYYWSKLGRYMEDVVEASKVLIDPEDTLIRLPKDLYEMESRMNNIKQAAIRNERAARDELQRRNDLLVYLAHDLKTPLTSVVGYLSLLNEAPDMPPEQKAKFLGITLDKAYRLDQLIDEFFDITRFNLQSILINKGKINLTLMLNQMADEFYPLLAPRNKTAVVNAPESLVLLGDADKLSRVFNNILKNAIAYSYDNCAIEINAFRDGEYTVIVFTNQGDPIPQEKLKMIFEKFFRLDSSRSSNTGGAGLGLAIAKEIVTAHGGTIYADSNRERTVFTVRLPNQ